ncbi:MAG: hypothetical protein ABSG96_23840 [Terracidiphilus sp.]|jgi:hypothetical protein
MTVRAGWYAAELRRELGLRSRLWARGRAHVESYGTPPVTVFSPDEGRHGNFFDASYAAIAARPEWMRRFDKIHAQGRALPKSECGRRWRELDSSMSSDALLMNVFCSPGVVEDAAVRRTLGVDSEEAPVFGWKARVPLTSGPENRVRFDRTEVDMRWGGLLVEAKLTEGDFQTRAARIVEGYRDFDAVFERELLPRVELREARRRTAVEFAEEYTQEWEGEAGEDAIPSGAEAQGSSSESTYGLKPVPFAKASESTYGLKPVPFAKASESTYGLKPVPFAKASGTREEIAREFQAGLVARAWEAEPVEAGYASYQLIRNVLAAYAEGCSFCVVHDERRPDLREAWFAVMAAVRSAEMRVRCKVMTWQELAALVPEELQDFLDVKYGIVGAGRVVSIVGDLNAE